MMLGQVKKGIAILIATYATCGVGYMLTIVFAVCSGEPRNWVRLVSIDVWTVVCRFRVQFASNPMPVVSVLELNEPEVCRRYALPPTVKLSLAP